MNQQSYYAVIPANVRYCKDVCDGAKLLYGEITALSNQNGYCWATNKYFADLYGKSSDTISRWISELAGAGFIATLVDSAAANSRKIWLAGSPGVSAKMPIPIGKNADTLSAKMPIPIGKNAVSYKENNTKSNTKKEEKENAALSSSSEPENISLEAEKEKSLPPVAPAPLPVTVVEVHEQGAPVVTVYEHMTAKQYPTQEPHGEYKRVNIAEEIDRLKTDYLAKENFTRTRRIPASLFEEYVDAFATEIGGTGETYPNVPSFRKHFFNWSGSRFEIQSRKAAQPKPQTSNGQPAKIRQL